VRNASLRRVGNAPLKGARFPWRFAGPALAQNLLRYVCSREVTEVSDEKTRVKHFCPIGEFSIVCSSLRELGEGHMGKSNYREVDCPECLRIVKKKYNLSDWQEEILKERED